MSLLTGDLAAEIYGAMADIFLDATLEAPTNEADGDYDPATLGYPTTVYTDYACKAIVESYSDYFVLQGLVKAGERKVLILQDSLATTPQEGDRIVVGGETLEILSLSQDPAGAIWEARVKPVIAS